MTRARWIFWGLLLVASFALFVAAGPGAGAWALLLGGLGELTTRRGLGPSPGMDDAWIARRQQSGKRAEAEAIRALVRAKTERDEVAHGTSSTAAAADRVDNARRLSRFFGFGGKAEPPPGP